MLEFDRVRESLRARLATERLLSQRQRELTDANTKIAAHAKVLTDEVIERREQARRARADAETLKSKNREAMKNLRRARSDTEVAERRLWASLETIEDGFAIFGRDHRIATANRAFFAPFADLDFVTVGTPYEELVDLAAEEGLVDTGDLQPAEWARWMKARWRETPIPPVTLRFWNNRYVRLTENRTDDGDIVLIATNMTETMRREKALEDARMQAEAASRAKSSFLANMSHEIRTPMNGVLAMADLLQEGTLDDEQALCVDTIRSSGEALLVIINDILDYSKIEAQKLDLVEEPLDLERTVGEVATLLMPSAREKNLSLAIDYDLFLPTGFFGDKGRLRQILMNLVGNALKFTEKGHVLIRVVGLPDSGENACQLHITVEDTGIGIAKDKQAHVFGEFNQADSEMTRRFDGTGLGLSITKRLVQMMGGEIWVESEEGKGSVFGFRLRLRPDRSMDAARPELPTAGRRLVISDPDATNHSILSKQLMALGLELDVSVDPSDPINPGSIGPDDMVAIAESSGPTGSLRLGLGPEALSGDSARTRTLQRPILRRPLFEALRGVLSAASNTGPAQAPPGPTNGEDPGPRRMRVLAAEDNKTNRLVLTKLLKKLEITLELAENGEEAVALFRADPHDLVLTDISMPKLDGKEAACQIRAHCTAAGLPPVPIIAMTAHAMDEQRQEILEAGIDSILTKPLKRDAIIAEIVKHRPDAALNPVPD